MPNLITSLLDPKDLHGLALVGPTTSIAPQALRRARNLHETCNGELRPAPGYTVLQATGGKITSIVRFHDKRFYMRGSALYADGTLIEYSLRGTRMTMLRIPPGNTQPDQLFVAGRGTTFKVDEDLVVSTWGIEHPDNGMTVVKDTQLTKTIELFEDFTTWTLVGTGLVASNEAVIVQEGTNALQLDVPADIVATATKNVAVDLSLFSVAKDSSAEDFIELWVRIDGNAQAFDYLTLRFDIASTGTAFGSNYYQYKFLPTSVTVNRMIVKGIGSRADVAQDEAGFLADNGGNENDAGSYGEMSEGVSDSGDGEADGPGTSSATWSRLRVAKASFLRVGESSRNWAHVRAMQLMVKTNALGAVTCYFDYCRMRGGAGMRGDYQSLVTFDNTDTGARSNSNPRPVKVPQNDRQKLVYASIPVSTDPQVNARTLWRTFGDGKRFFREHVIEDNTTTTYTSSVADFIGLWTVNDAKILYLPELPTDNARPDDTHLDFIYDQATVFWLSNGTSKKGRVYYSPAGRPEAQKGFIQVCQDDTPLLRIVVWQRARYVIGDAGWWRIDGTEPYTAFKFEGVPGVHADQVMTIVPTSYGIVYQAHDGLRVFNGSTSQLLFFDRIGPLFRGEALGQLAPFLGICAAFARDQYFISDGAQTLALNLKTGFIRDLGLGFHALYYEAETRLLLGGLADVGLVIVEDVGVPPVVDCSFETAALYAPPGETRIIQRLYIDANTQGESMSVTLMLDDLPIDLPPCVLTSRGVQEYALGKAYHAVGVRMTVPATLSTRVYRVYADVYSNSQQSSQT